VDLETGDARMVLPGIVDREAFSRDANTVYTWGGGKQPNAIVSHDLRTGEERVLHSRPVASEIQNPNLSLSPDGTMLALQLRNVPPGYDSLAVMPATGGEPRTILQIRRPEWFGANSFAWSPDMRYIFAARNLTNHSEIWRVPVNGGPAQPTGLSMAGDIRQLHLNPNGRQFVFTNARGAGEVWVLENFLPPVPPARPARR
jgi:Tol biopolymer transport system component